MAQFILDNMEQQLAEDYKKYHKEKCHPDVNFEYIFVETGIGVSVLINCRKCNQKEDISNHSVW